jgi:hypothetical protein
MKERTVCFIVLVASVSLPMSLMAQPDSLSFGFTGHVVDVTDPGDLLGGSVSIDDPVAGVFTYDLSTTDLRPEENMGEYFYDSPPNGIRVTISGLTFQTDPSDTQVSVYTKDTPESSGTGIDQFALTSKKCLLPYNPNVTVDDWISLYLTDNTRSALSSDNLPSSLDIDDWDEKRLLIVMYELSTWPYILGVELETLNACINNETGLCTNGIDDDCDGAIDGTDPDCTSTCAGPAGASTLGASPVYGTSSLGKLLAYFLLSIGAVIFLGIWRRKR